MRSVWRLYPASPKNRLSSVSVLGRGQDAMAAVLSTCARPPSGSSDTVPPSVQLHTHLNFCVGLDQFSWILSTAFSQTVNQREEVVHGQTNSRIQTGWVVHTDIHTSPLRSRHHPYRGGWFTDGDQVNLPWHHSSTPPLQLSHTPPHVHGGSPPKPRPHSILKCTVILS